ncbi:glycosyltransferase family 4 protein [Mucilaginibacter achroorhodeus]|uniref:Glycosyltransferase family 4 protein n=1 Tax=Mucilaginibacter achroorhodeus TaxID=2599294 RepID=A0A563U4I9_9SPHI|nr:MULTISPECIES: glycosyltransferase family 4 protein [Mucilaginibacter]QXV64276.1 glycosyltransferase family 4 protein [Mucilaginibacter sp. 21P]TWR26235.1 glycosyltransferase family 4 protein [Mucilaginibacter achroorhodeus]
MQNKLKVFTWHIHGSYLFYLSQGNYDIYIPTKPEKTEGYYGRGETFPFGNNVIEIPAEEVKHQTFDCIVYQTNNNYLTDQYEILSEEQRKLPRIYIEHDPPRQHPTDTKHVVDDPKVTLVHVTHFNRLMWDSNNTPTRVIEHGVTDSGVVYKGDLDKGIVVINNLPARGRLLGYDIFMNVRKHVPLDLVGMGTGDLGLGEVLHPQLPEFQSRYRFFFNPIRYTSLGLAICEAMMMGIPVIGLATTELSAVIENGVSGFIHTDVDYLVEKMKLLIREPELALEIGNNGRKVAMQRFNIERFANDWEQLFNEVTNTHVPEVLITAS